MSNKKLKEFRIRKGLSQGDVAKAMGYSTPQFISNWERGISHPPFKDMKKLASTYGVTKVELFQTVWEYKQSVELEKALAEAGIR